MNLLKSASMLLLIMFLVVISPTFATEKECRSFKTESLKLVGDGEKVQEELGRQSLTIDKAQRKIVNKKIAKLARTAEDLNVKIDKANCKQYDWFLDKDKNQEAKWCQLHNEDRDHYCQCEFPPSLMLQLKEGGKDFGDKISEAKDADGKVVQVTIGEKIYYRESKDCLALANEGLKKQQDEDAKKKKENPFE
jgi:hypothetical protein